MSSEIPVADWKQGSADQRVDGRAAARRLLKPSRVRGPFSHRAVTRREAAIGSSARTAGYGRHAVGTPLAGFRLSGQRDCGCRRVSGGRPTDRAMRVARSVRRGTRRSAKPGVRVVDSEHALLHPPGAGGIPPRQQRVAPADRPLRNRTVALVIWTEETRVPVWLSLIAECSRSGKPPATGDATPRRREPPASPGQARPRRGCCAKRGRALRADRTRRR